MVMRGGLIIIIIIDCGVYSRRHERLKHWIKTGKWWGPMINLLFYFSKSIQSPKKGN
jgi:uncharacterized membrane protein YdjX (TVP38/TMEM64 family)